MLVGRGSVFLTGSVHGVCFRIMDLPGLHGNPWNPHGVRPWCVFSHFGPPELGWVLPNRVYLIFLPGDLGGGSIAGRGGGPRGSRGPPWASWESLESSRGPSMVCDFAFWTSKTRLGSPQLSFGGFFSPGNPAGGGIAGGEGVCFPHGVRPWCVFSHFGPPKLGWGGPN